MIGIQNRHTCCKHCPDQGCPLLGHAGPCTVAWCPSEYDSFGDAPLPEEAQSDKAPIDILQALNTERIENMRESLIDHVTTLVGYEPPGIRVLLRSLSHPDVAGEAKEYFEAMDLGSRCLNYEPPWSCAREAEAHYQNIKFGWLASANGVGYDESWCENCRRKVMGT